MTERRVQTNFTASGGAFTRVAAPVTEVPSVATAEAPVGVPQGTAREVLAWVGSDEDRAKQAIEAEKAASDPRKVLLSTLHKLAHPKTTYVLQESEPRSTSASSTTL